MAHQMWPIYQVAGRNAQHPVVQLPQPPPLAPHPIWGHHHHQPFAYNHTQMFPGQHLAQYYALIHQNYGNHFAAPPRQPVAVPARQGDADDDDYRPDSPIVSEPDSDDDEEPYRPESPVVSEPDSDDSHDDNMDRLRDYLGDDSDAESEDEDGGIRAAIHRALHDDEDEEEEDVDGVAMPDGPASPDASDEEDDDEDDDQAGDDDPVGLMRRDMRRIRNRIRRMHDNLVRDLDDSGDEEEDWEQLEFDLEEDLDGRPALPPAAEAAKTARIQELRNADENPTSIALRYTRTCNICLTPNPARRAVLVACGHMMCAACAEQLSEGDSGKFACPQCRKRTGFINTFEDIDENPAPVPAPHRPDEAQAGRKRGNEEGEEEEEEAGPSTSAAPKRRRIDVITIE